MSGLRLAFVRGTSPNKWADRWALTHSDRPLELIPLRTSHDAGRMLDRDGIAASHSGGRDSDGADNSDEPTLADVVLERVQPEASPEGTQGPAPWLHAVRLYVEDVVLVLPADHELADEPHLTAEDLSLLPLLGHPDHAALWPRPAPWHDPSFAPANAAAALDLVETGLGGALLPAPLARHLTRKTLTLLPVEGLAGTVIWAIWRRDEDSPEIQDLIGVFRGRGSRSSRAQRA